MRLREKVRKIKREALRRIPFTWDVVVPEWQKVVYRDEAGNLAYYWSNAQGERRDYDPNPPLEGDVVEVTWPELQEGTR